jgi:hypothetical protein
VLAIVLEEHLKVKAKIPNYGLKGESVTNKLAKLKKQLGVSKKLWL